MTDAARNSSRMGWLSLGPLGARRRPSGQESTGGGTAAPRGRLFRKYVLLIVGLVSVVLLINSALDFWFAYEENKAALFRIQQEKAGSAARRIEQFVDEIERQLGWTTAPQWAASPLEQRKFDYVRLLRQVPAITELTQLDDAGKEQLKVSRLAMDVVGSEKDYSQSPSFVEAKKNRVWFSPVHFRKESEPYMTVALARAGRSAGITVAEVNLKLIWDVITGLKIGQRGYAYVVDRDGRLIAHPDISLVLRNTDLANLPQVASALAEAPSLPSPAGGGGSGWGQPIDQAVMVAKGVDGKPVLTAHAAIAPLGWTVFVELPLSEALAPLYGSALRTAALLALALILATSAALLLARRMTGPIRKLQAGAARIGAGELDRHIDIHTGDELEDLAGDFNRMASDLQRSYADLEKKVEDRTAELKEALDQQTATAEVLQVINRSPGDLAPVFQSIVEKAHTLCGAACGSLQLWDGEKFRGVAMRGFSEAMVEQLRLGYSPSDMPCQRLVEGEHVVHCVDLAEIDSPVAREGGVKLGGIRTILYVALRKDDVLLGQIVAARQEVRPFSEKEIGLVESFAAQAVIAMENARLLGELRQRTGDLEESLEYQTAISDVLRVISRSTFDLQPVLDTLVKTAARLCGAELAGLFRRDGEVYRLAASVAVAAEGLALFSDMPFQAGRGTALGRAALDRATVHIADIAADPEYALPEEVIAAAPFRTVLAVPLLREGEPIGVVNLGRRRVEPFTDGQIDLVRTFADQAVIAMENARLITETREALEQQTATAEVLGVINSSPGDLVPVFGAILEKAHALCGAAFGGLFSYDGDQFHAVVFRGVPEALRELVRQPFRPETGNPFTRLVRGESLLHIPDLRAVASPDDPVAQAGTELGGIRTLLVVPLRKDDTLLGVITSYRQEVRPFSDKQIALLQNFAAQAVIAMENARLLTETREALEQQTATAEVLQIINSSPGDPTPVFDAILEKAHTLCGAAHGSLTLTEGEHCRAVATRGMPEEFARVLRQPFHPGLLGERLSSGELFVQIADITVTPTDSSLHRAAVGPGAVRTLLAVPLSKDGALLGYITANRQEVRPFSDKQIALLQNFAAQAVIAMENARLITETREALEQQTATAEVLGVINSSPGDLAPVFDAVLEKAHSLCGITYGSLQLYDGERFRAVAVHGYSESLVEPLREGWSPSPNHPIRGLLDGAHYVHIRDLAEIDDPAARRVAELGGIRTTLFVALRKDGTLLGMISSGREEIRPFSEKEIALLQNFAAQAVIAIENTRLINETREALEQQTATAEVLQVINSSPGDLAPVFDAILEKAHSLCGAAYGSLHIADGEAFRAVAVRGMPGAFADLIRRPFQPGRNHPVRKLIGGAPFAVVINSSEFDDPIIQSALKLAGMRIGLFVPLRKENVLFGYIVASRPEVQQFTDKQVALLQNFAAQAVIAMENARLITETREALEQQTATTEVLQVINSSPGDLAPIFDAMLDKATRLCEAAFGTLFTYDGECFHAVALRGVPAVFADALDAPVRPEPGASLHRIARGEPFAHFADVANEAAFRGPAASALVELGGARSTLAVPLRKDDALLGAFAVYRQEVRPFSEKQIALLQNFAAQAVIAMENARLITETREALEQQTATAEVLGVINSSPGDLAPVFDAILEKAHTLCGAAEGSLLLYDHEHFRAVAMRGVPELFADRLRHGYRGSDTPASQPLMAGARFVHIPDLAEVEHPIARAAVEHSGNRTLLSVPLRKGDALFGMIVATRQEVRPFSDKQIALLQSFAAQAVIAMENARLITETREALEQQTATAEVLGVINSSPSDLTPVFSAILEKAHGLCGITFGTLQLYDGEKLRAVATRGFPEPQEKVIREPYAPDLNSPLQGLIDGGRYVQFPDLAERDTQVPNPRSRVAADLGIRTLLFLPLRKDSRLLGLISAARKEAKLFSEREIALLENFAAQAVIAMENARLITELRESLGYQTATSDVLRVVSRSTFDLDAVLQTVVTTAIRLCRADSATIYRNEGGEYRWAAGHMLVPEYEEIERNVIILPGTGTVVGRAALEGRTVQILDAWIDPLYEAKEDARVGGVHTMIGVPLLREGAPIGVIGLARRRVEAFSEREIQLVTTFADQAVIAIENARLITELRERTHDLLESLEYQTATSDVLKVISRSAFDLQPVLETVADTAARLCESEMAFILRRDGEVYRAAAALGWSPEYREYLESHPIVPNRGTLTGRVVLEGRAVQIADIATDPEYTLSEATTLGEAHTQLGVPLLRENIPIGVIILSRRTVKPFTEKQIELVTTFADQAVIAIENARLLNDLQQRTRDLQESLEYQTATSDVLKVISRSGAELDPVLDVLVETAARICQADKAFVNQLRDGLYRTSASFGFSAEYKSFMIDNPIAPGRGTVTGRVALEGRVIQIEDVVSDPEYTLRGWEAQWRTGLGVPLFRGTTVIGVIFLARSRVEPFTEKQIELVTTFADQAVIAIENARLLNELRARTNELGSSVAELKMLNEVAQAVSSTLDLRTVLSTVLNASLGVTWANAGAVFRYSRAERAFRLVEAVGWDEALTRSVSELRLAETETAMGDAVARRMPVQLADTAQRASNPLRDITLAAGFHSALIVPLVGAERILGAIILMRQEAGEFPAETVRLMQTLASQSVLAIQNARLFREIADKSEQLALASQHKSQFLANMSHELRTPLNAILGYAELLVDGIYGVLPDRPKGVLERIQNNGKHLLALINDVLDLAKIEAGQLTLTLEDYSVPEVVKSVVTATEPLATSKGLKFTAAVQDDLPMAHGDARRVSQVLLNLVGNAIKFTDKGEVEIRAGTDKGQFVLTVRDTGPGIADADQERIFGEFQQIDNSNTRKKGGTGLGLAISKRMVETQGGTISVDSILGQGSTFRVVLPVHVDEMMEAA